MVAGDMRDPQDMLRICGYVEQQDDYLLPTLTVKEHLRFQVSQTQVSLDFK